MCSSDLDEWGIRPAGLSGPRSNPWAAELEQVGETPEPEEAEDSGEDEAQRGDNPSGEDGASRSANPSGGSVSSPRGAPHGEDLQESSSNEDALPLFAYAEENVREARQLLPSFDEWGIRPAGLRGPRNNPWAAELEQVGETDRKSVV